MTARVALLSRYVKGARQLELKNWKRESVQDSLPPVLYHGTARYAVEFWQKAGIQHRTFSLAGDPTYAARFATYFVAEKPWPGCVATELRNSSDRRILVDPMIVEQFGLQAEYKQLQQGRVVQALTFFDRDMLLAGEGKHFELEWEFDWNAGLLIKHPKDYQKAFEAMFAVLYYDIEAGHVEFKVFNPYLWKANFSVRPAPIGNLARFIPAKKHAEMRRTELGMYIVAKKLFLGAVLGRPEQRFLGMRGK
jgi:hypothetical protein